MLIRTPHAAAATATTALFICSLGLAGCSSGTDATVFHTPALKTAGGRNTARSSVQTAILVADTTNGIALPGGPTPASIARRVFAIVNGRRTSATGTSTGACNNGVKSSQTTNGTTGATTTTTDYYYEPACATLEAEETITVDKPATPGNTTGSGKITSYDKAGAVHVVQKLTLTVTTTAASATPPNQETFTMVDSASTTDGGSTVAAVAATCVGTPPSATVNCSVAHYGVSGGTTFGEVFVTAATAGTSGGNSNATVSIAFYAGATYTLTQSGSNWLLSGGNAFNNGTGTYGYTTTGPSGSGTLTLKDGLYTYVETATLASTGLSSTIIENPNAAVSAVTPIATASVDVAGTGVLNFADGTSETIAGGLIGF
jgi:hypothetical protein